METICPTCGGPIDLGAKGYALGKDANTVFTPRGEVQLTPTEMELLRLLVTARAPVVTETLADRLCWGKDLKRPRLMVLVYVCRLNKKLGPVGLCVAKIPGTGTPKCPARWLIKPREAAHLWLNNW